MGLKNLLEKTGFIEFTEEDNKEAASLQNATPSIKPLGVRSTISYVPEKKNVDATQEDIQKFESHFNELFDKANLPGPDYYEFQKMCQAMAALPDETKFPAIFGGLQVQGLTKQTLVESANHYISLIDEDSKKFNSAIDGKIMSEVAQKKNSIIDKRKGITEREEMIKKLQEEIASETVSISTLEKEANEQEAKANQKSITYKAACETRKALINSDLQKINNLIK